MKRLLLVLAAAPFLLAVACGGGAAPEPVAPPAETTAPAGAAPAPSASVAASAEPAAASDAPSAAPSVSSGPPPADPTLATGEATDAACGAAALPYEEKIRPEIKKCFFEVAMKKNPNVDGHVKIVVNIDPQGKVTSQKIVQEKELGKEATACMMKVLKDHKIDAGQCKGKAMSMNMAFGAAARDKK
jgi:hypothetical protein